MPAPPANRNRTRHGLTAGRLPKGASYIKRTTDKLRNVLEAATLESRGEVGLYEAATIQTCIRWERHALLSQRWLWAEPDLTPDQRLAFSREVARASAERDKCLRALGLDRSAADDAWAILDAEPPADPEADGSDRPDKRSDQPDESGHASPAGPEATAAESSPVESDTDDGAAAAAGDDGGAAGCEGRA